MAISQGSTQTTIRDQATGALVGVSSDRLKVDSTDSGVLTRVTANQFYSFAVDVNMATAGTNNPIVLLRNPNGSGKVIHVWLVDAGAVANNTEAEFSLFSSPTVTSNGSAITVGSRNIGGGASAAVLLATSLPTVSSNGTRIEGKVYGQNGNSVELGREFSVAIQANNSLLITGNPNSNGRIAQVTVIWAEI